MCDVPGAAQLYRAAELSANQIIELIVLFGVSLFAGLCFFITRSFRKIPTTSVLQEGRRVTGLCFAPIFAVAFGWGFVSYGIRLVGLAVNDFNGTGDVEMGRVISIVPLHRSQEKIFKTTLVVGHKVYHLEHYDSQLGFLQQSEDEGPLRLGMCICTRSLGETIVNIRTLPGIDCAEG